MSKIALVAGEGDLPLYLFQVLKAKGEDVLVCDLAGRFSFWQALGATVQPVDNPLAFGAMVADIKSVGVTGLMMAGRFPKDRMYRRDQMDVTARAVVDHAAGKDDHSLLDSLVAALAAFGIAVLPYDVLIPDLLAPAGHIAGREPTAEEWADAREGKRILDRLLPLSFGQALAMRGGAVTAVEAMEGTDAMILRAGQVAGCGVVVKGLRADQDRRFDLPTIGMTTVQTLAQSGLTALFVAAGDTLVLDRSKLEVFCRERNLCVWGLE